MILTETCSEGHVWVEKGTEMQIPTRSFFFIDLFGLKGRIESTVTFIRNRMLNYWGSFSAPSVVLVISEKMEMLGKRF